ncbi:MAG TPA: hypothetical protein VHE35_25630 [Kofleriaceae bacterium]|nr:hypothetical protein [Kofleriaceae bacterium]
MKLPPRNLLLELAAGTAAAVLAVLAIRTFGPELRRYLNLRRM